MLLGARYRGAPGLGDVWTLLGGQSRYFLPSTSSVGGSAVCGEGTRERGYPRQDWASFEGSPWGAVGTHGGLCTHHADPRSVVRCVFWEIPHGRRKVHGLWTLLGVSRYRRPLPPAGKGGRRGLVWAVLRKRPAGGSRFETLESLRQSFFRVGDRVLRV